MEPYKISIILPCYQVAQYIERCINSILTQDFPNYEVIIINDGSPDNLLQICKQWEGLPNFTILSFPNQGLSQARNEGLAYRATASFNMLPSSIRHPCRCY